MGIPHSHYLGGPNQWTVLDRAKAEEWLAYKREFCTGCGTRARDWDPKLGGHRHAYYADTERCPGCEMREQLSEQLPERALGVSVVLKPNVDVLEEEEAA